MEMETPKKTIIEITEEKIAESEKRISETKEVVQYLKDNPMFERAIRFVLDTRNDTMRGY
jgi:hypothetical protein